MNLQPQTRLQELLEAWPFLAELLAGLSPSYRILRRPLLRRTLARGATVERMAAMGGLPVDRLMARIAEEVRARTGAEIEVEGEGPPSEAGRGADAGAGAGVREDAGDADASRAGRERVERVPPGHPVHTFTEENRMAESLVEKIEAIFRAGACGEDVSRLVVLVRDLADIDRHYRRAESQLFPVLEERGAAGPAAQMRAIHDDVRARLQKTLRDLEVESVPAARECFHGLCRKVRDLIDREQRDLFPLALERLSESDWLRVRAGEERIGYAWVKPGLGWTPPLPGGQPAAGPLPGGGPAPGTGPLTSGQLDLLLRHLPLELTFVDERDEVAWYSEGRERVFPRSPEAIGRPVRQCHPPESVPAVERILQAFRSGERDSAESWFRMEGRFVHVRYFALRDGRGGYRGTLEVSQDVTGIRALEGEQRLPEWSIAAGRGGPPGPYRPALQG